MDDNVFHEKILKELCGVCGQRARTHKETKRPAKKVQSYIGDVEAFYGLCLQNDDTKLHPDKLCTICYRRIINSKVDGRARNFREIKQRPLQTLFIPIIILLVEILGTAFRNKLF